MSVQNRTARRVKSDAARADNRCVTATRTRPRIAARDFVAAAARLFGVIVLDVADLTIGPAVYRARLAVFEQTTVDGDLITSDDDGSLIVLADRRRVDELLEVHGTPGRAAAALTAELRAAGVL